MLSDIMSVTIYFTEISCNTNDFKILHVATWF